MRVDDLTISYQLIAELLLSPDERDRVRIESLHARLSEALPRVDEWITKFLSAPASDSRDEYVQTVELSPTCPLYMGSYLYDEPSTCNGVGSSGRNAYMLELIGLYQHFELDLAGAELPDFLPVMVDFLWISLESSARERDPLRRWCLEHHVQPGLDPLCESLTKYESPYLFLISALREAVEEDLRRLDDVAAWKPSDEQDSKSISLPVLAEPGAESSGVKPPLNQLELQP